jgi:hypothetical protein
LAELGPGPVEEIHREVHQDPRPHHRAVPPGHLTKKSFSKNVRQARVRDSARHPTEVPLAELRSDEDTRRRASVIGEG